MQSKLTWILLACVVFSSLFIATKGGAATVIDQAGREVDVPENPVRVVSLAPSITEMVFAVGRGDRLVGVTEFSNFPKKAEQIESVGSYVFLDLERIVSLKPDLCIAVKDGNPIAIIERLERFGIPVFAVNPRGIESVMKALSDIGNILNAETAAQSRIADMKNRIAYVKNRIETVSTRPRVFFQIGVDPIVSAGSDTFIHELIRIAGGRNIAAPHKGYPRFSFEEVLSHAPDIIIVTSMARQNVFETVVARWREWKDMPAVTNDRIYLVDSDVFDRPSPRLVEGLEKLARLIHPCAFENTGGR